MPKKVQKTLQDYLSKVKSPRQPQNQSRPFNSLSFSSSKNWIIGACKHPRTPSFALDQSHGGRSNNNHKDDAATLADVDRFLYENFKSLYFRDDEETEDYNTTTTKRVSSEEIQNEAPKLGPIMFESPRFVETPPHDDLCGSARFFVKPGLSGSLLVEDALTSMMTTRDQYAGSSTTSTITNTDSSSNNSHNEHHCEKLPDNCIALLTSTSSPYEDFRRSMQDVLDARSKSHGRVIDWDFMEELLFSYLSLNEKKSHKFILSAFVDVIAAMRRNLETTAPGKPRSVRTVRIGREVTKKTKEVTLEFGSSN